MDNLAADFTIKNNNPLEVEYTLTDNKLDCVFEIYAAGTVWGSVDGDINNQTDLINILNNKVDLTSFNNLSQTVTNNYTELSSDITDLTTTVTDNYSTLNGQISNLNTTVNNNYTSLNNRLTTTSQNVLNLTDTVTTNNTAINNRVDSIVDSFDSDIETINTTIQNEITTRANNDTLLQNSINTLENNLNTEISDRTTADNTLQNNINTLSETVSGNYSELSEDIGELETTVNNNYTALDGNITTLTNTVNTNNTAINNKVDGINTSLTNSLNSLTSTVSSNYTTLDTKIDNTKTAIDADISDLSNTVNQNYTDLNNAITTSASTINSRIDSEVSTLNDAITNENHSRQSADANLQAQIDAITAASDVTDIVGTYAQLQAYDTTNLPNNSIIKVLSDESRDNETTYYRWVITNSVGAWVLIGEEGPYYTKSEVDNTFVTKTTTINNIPLSNNITLTASDVNALPDTTVIGDGVLTLQINGEDVDTFNANTTTNKTINLPVPTDTRDLTNNAGYITSNALNGYATENWVTEQNYVNDTTLTNTLGDYVTNTSLSTTLTNYVTDSNLTSTLSDYALNSSIPTKTSELINNSNFATVSQIPTNNNQLANGAGYVTNTDLTSTLSDYALNSSIPIVNNGTLTIQKNGVFIGSFSANQSTDETINILADEVLTDDITISKNNNDELQAIGVIDDNSGSALKTWTGTKAEYDAIVTKDADTLYNVTNDNTADAYQAYTKSEVDTLIQNALNDALYYKAGDSYSFVEKVDQAVYAISVAAMLSDAAKMIVFSLFLPKSLNNISNITINSLKTNIRANGTYIPSGYTAGGIDAFTFSDVMVRKIKDNIVTICLNLNTAANVTNNIPISVEINAITLSFS